jgi:hypothetical protein
MNKQTLSSSNIGFCSLLTLLFIGLKLTGYIAWSWWWVLSPILIPSALILSMLFIAVLVYMVLSLLIIKK